MYIFSNSDSLGRLKSVLIGNVSRFSLQQEAKIHNIEFERLKDEVEIDRQKIVAVLKQCGINVVEIPYIDEDEDIGHGLASVRNNILVLKDEIITSLYYTYKDKEYFSELQDIIDNNKNNILKFKERNIKIDNSLKCKDEEFFNNYPIDYDKIEERMNFDCANILRFNDNIFMNISTVPNIYGYHYLKDRYREYKWHPLSVCAEHIDGTITILREGLLLLHRGYKVCWREMLPKFFHSWHKIFYPTPWIDENSYLIPKLNRGTTDINILILDKNMLLVDEHTARFYLNRLKKYKIYVIPVRLRHKYCWGGGLHCITNDLERY